MNREEEILNRYFNAEEGFTGYETNCITAAMREYAREMSIGFNDFVQKYYNQVWCGINMGNYYQNGEDIMTATHTYTTDQLYDKYLETLNKKS
jgi:hypothetical protein